MSNLIISELAIYPVKSMRQIQLKRSLLHMGGLKYDRRWMVVDAEGVMITQRKIARLCLIQPELINPEVDCSLLLSAPEMKQIKVSVPDSTRLSSVKVWDDSCQSQDAGDQVAGWLSQFLGIQCRLVYFPEKEVRIVDQQYAQPNDRTGFSDGFPILLTTQASLDDLNSRLSKEISMARFRPNIVLSGGEAFSEDGWKQLKTGNITFRIVKPCSRCIMPCIDIATADRDQEPIKTLLAYRKHGNEIIFGQNVIADGHGELALGMKLALN